MTLNRVTLLRVVFVRETAVTSYLLFVLSVQQLAAVCRLLRVALSVQQVSVPLSVCSSCSLSFPIILRHLLQNTTHLSFVVCFALFSFIFPFFFVSCFIFFSFFFHDLACFVVPSYPVRQRSTCYIYIHFPLQKLPRTISK